jgi:SAM-dependent methyltransferase
MLFPLIKKGYSCNGIEPSGYFSEFLKKKNVKLFKNIDEIKNKKFDLIIHFFVLEHIKDPIKFLIQQTKLLKQNGKIIFEIPCYSDALSNIYDIPEFERFYWSKAHPWYFNKFSIKYLLKKLNKKFSISFDQRYNLSNHIYWSRYRVPGGQNFYSKSLGTKIENLYKKELIKNGYADTLICAIYK